MGTSETGLDDDESESVGEGGSATSTSGPGDSDSAGDGTGDPPEPSPQPQSLCPDVSPDPEFTAVTVEPSEVSQLHSILQEAGRGTAVLLEPGVYRLEQPLVIGAAGVYFGSSTHRAADVLLDGGLQLDNLLRVEASDVTVANLSWTATREGAVVVTGGPAADTSGVELVNLIFRDVRRAVAVRPSAEGYYSDDGSFACSTVRVTDVARQALGGICNISGFGALGAQRWTVRDSVFDGIWCMQGTTEYSIVFAGGARDVLVERNRIVQSSRGIRLGRNTTNNGRPLPDPACGGGDADVVGARIYNNMIAGTDTELFASQQSFVDGISVWRSCGVEVAHNTIVGAQSPVRGTIEYRWADDDIGLFNNLLSHPIVEREESAATRGGNLESIALSIFEDAASGDLHLDPTSSSELRGVRDLLSRVSQDFDGEVRADPPNVGADEL